MKINRSLFAIAFIIPLFSWLNAFSQNTSDNVITINGQILNKSNSEPVPYAHIQLKGASFGTVSNQAGRFVLKIPKSFADNPSIKISCIGFKSITIQVLNSELITIRLTEDTKILQTVIIRPMQDTLALSIVRRAVAAIERNYPNQSERLEGYFEESIFSDSLSQHPVYLAEAILEVLKEPYSQIARHGQVKLIKGRKYVVASLDSMAIKIFAGPHNPHRFDFVHRREGPLGRSDMDNYHYAIADTVKFDGKDVVVISFSSRRNASRYGKLYIALPNLAFIKGDFDISEEDENRIKSGLYQLKGVRRLYLKYTTDYQFTDSAWRFKSAVYHTAFEKDTDTIYLKNSFFTTKYDPSSDDIPYVDRIQYRTVFLDSAKSGDDHFWDQYSFIPPSNLEKKIYVESEKPTQPLPTLHNSRLDILRKFRIGLSAFYYAPNTPGLNATLNQSTAQFNASTVSKTTQYFGISSSVFYQVSRHVQIGFETTSSFNSIAFSSYGLTVAYEHNVLPKRRPLFIAPTLKAAYGTRRVLIGSLNDSPALALNGKTFDSKTIDVYYSTRGYYVTPALALILEKSVNLNFVASVGYNFYFETKDGLFFRENQPFYKAKKTFVSNGTDGTNIQKVTGESGNGITIQFGIVLRM